MAWETLCKLKPTRLMVLWKSELGSQQTIPQTICLQTRLLLVRVVRGTLARDTLAASPSRCCVLWDVFQGVGTQTQTSSGDAVPHLGFAALGSQSCTTGRELPDGPIYGHLIQTLPFAVKVANTPGLNQRCHRNKLSLHEFPLDGERVGWPGHNCTSQQF